MVRQTRFDFALFAALAAVMLVTRTHWISHVVHLPDTVWASFFVAGFYIRARLAFPALFLLGFAIDLAVIGNKGGTSFCFTPAYWMLLPAYGAMWLAGRFSARRFGASARALPAIVGTMLVALVAAKLLSSGGFYFLSGRFPDASVAGFLPRMTRYFPPMLWSTLIWASLAIAAHALVALLQPRTDDERA